MSSTGIRGWASVLGLVAVAGLAVGQEAKPQQTPTLQGPEVKDNSVPGQKRTFGEGSKERRAESRPIGIPVITRALEVVRGEKAGDNRLTDEQDAKLKSTFEGFQKETREYLQKNREEISSLRSKLSPEDRAKADQALGGNGRVLRAGKTGFKGKAPKDAKPQGEETMTGHDGQSKGEEPKVDAAESAKARARILEIFAGRPKPEDAQAKAWAVLTEGQRTLVQAEVARIQKEGEKRPAKDVAAAPDFKSMSEQEIMNDPRVPERLRKELQAMVPEQREKVVQKIREHGVAVFRANGRQNRGEAKPAPKLTDVKVPEAN